MRLYIRKSISVGPFRFNLSKSGLGVSAGIKGLRVGTGPRGNYVRMGVKGIYYRTTIPKNSNNQHDSVNIDPIEACVPLSSTHEPLKEIESSDVTQIVDSSSAELLNELNSKRTKSSSWPFVITLFFSLAFIAYKSQLPQWAIATILGVGCILTWVAHTKDILAKTTVLFYDFEPEMESAYAQLLESAERLAKCSKVWHIAASGRVIARKYHAGASDLVERKGTTIRVTEPLNLQTNIMTVAIVVGRQTLHFLPDRVLIYDVAGIGAVSYKELSITVNDRQFIEDGSVPSDAQVVDKTWKYVNKSGGPDRRFKDNYEIPICLYQDMSFFSQSGLNELIQLSSRGPANDFKLAVVNLNGRLSKEVDSSAA
ncbi:DUF4236 domain-containing protein [Vibrio splendidus]|uniref:DUF4236 domain-containing protein n=1 Tax=Vibrio splendidus TaxID=29497 RepID=UPI00246837AF|nr:DUF4236 domain-containing protein [Vibrio splendidus]MDH5931493.1 DUF4236 domain-containing protein [Vibrio splendidus]